MELFQTFFMGGFECADHINRHGERVDMLAETGHRVRVREDYRLLAKAGIKTVREGISWSRVEKQPFRYDFSEVKNRMEAAREHGIQQLWELCHFGYPDDLMPTHPKFTVRFMALCSAFAEFYRKETNDPLFITPINEISFLAWHSGDMRGTVPFAVNSGFDNKYHLCKAAIQGIKTLRNIDPRCRILLTEPVVKIHPPEGSPLTKEIQEFNEHQFQAFDIIGGYMCPELGGSPDNLDIIGLNYYYNNQWEHQGGSIPWPQETAEKRRLPFSFLLKQVYRRYNRPLLLAETGHFGNHKERWLQEVTSECLDALRAGVDLQGICIYPVIDRPDWDDLSFYCNCGLWHIDEYKNRIPDQPYISMLMHCHEQIENLRLSRAILEQDMLEAVCV